MPERGDVLHAAFMSEEAVAALQCGSRLAHLFAVFAGRYSLYSLLKFSPVRQRGCLSALGVAEPIHQSQQLGWQLCSPVPIFCAYIFGCSTTDVLLM
jgi:hypothetical protein